MPDPVTGHASLDYAQAIAASMAAQDAPARRDSRTPVAPRPNRDQATVAATQGRAPNEIVLLDEQWYACAEGAQGGQQGYVCNPITEEQAIEQLTPRYEDPETALTEPVYQDENGNTYTQADLEAAQRAQRLIKGATIGVSAVQIGTGLAWGRKAVPNLIRNGPIRPSASAAANASRTTASGTTAANTASRTAARTAGSSSSAASTAANISRWGRAGRVAGTVARGGARVAVKALPVVGAGLSLWDIGTDVRNWNNPDNKRKVDDVARIGGNAAVVAGTALLFTPAAPVGAVIAVGGLIASGLGSIFGD